MTTLDKIRQLAPTTPQTPARDQRGIITAATLATWKGTDAQLGRALGVTRQAVSYARIVHKMPAQVDGRKGPRPGLSRTLITAILREANRRGIEVLDVMKDLNAHHWDGDVAEMGGGE